MTHESSPDWNHENSVAAKTSATLTEIIETLEKAYAETTSLWDKAISAGDVDAEGIAYYAGKTSALVFALSALGVTMAIRQEVPMHLVARVLASMNLTPSAPQTPDTPQAPA